MYDRILIATDGSELSAKGLQHGLELAAGLKAQVLVLTVTEPWMQGFDDALALAADPKMQEQYAQGCAQAARKILEDAIGRAAGAGVACETLHVADAYPAQAIVQAAEAHGAGLVVMASHGRSGLGRVLLGSQTQAVLVKSTVPVLVVR